MSWHERNAEHPNYARISYVWREHHRRFVAYVTAHGFVCQSCGGRGCDGYDSDYGPAEPCGWCETTGKVTRWLRGLYLRTMRDEKRRHRKIAALLVLACLSTACGDASLLSRPSAVTSAVAFSAENPRYSCPTGPPSFILLNGAVDMNASGRAALRWTDAAVEHYEVQLDRMNPDTNTWQTLSSHTTEKTALDIVLPGEGRYQARIRSQSCGLSGPWETSPVFSTDLRDGGIVLPAPPVEPTPEPPASCSPGRMGEGGCNDDPPQQGGEA